MPNPDIKEIAENLFDKVRQNFGDEYDSFQAEDKALLERVLNDLAVLEAQALAGVDISTEMPHIKAQLRNLQSISMSRVQSAINASIMDIFTGAVRALLVVL